MESILLRPAQKEHLRGLIEERDRIQAEINRFLVFTIKDLEVPNGHQFKGIDEGWVPRAEDGEKTEEHPGPNELDRKRKRPKIEGDNEVPPDEEATNE